MTTIFLDEKSRVETRPRLESKTSILSPVRTRSTSITKSPTKKFKGQFTLYPQEKLFKYSQVKIGESSVFADHPTLLELSNQLKSTLEDFDDKLLRVLHKHESNFLVAYKGVMRDVARDLKHYQEELDKNAQGYRESENFHLKKQMSILKEEVSKVLAVSSSYEADNRKLRNIIIRLKDELRCQNEVLLRTDDQVHELQQKCQSLKEQLQQKETEVKALLVVNEHLKPVSTIEAQQTDNSLNLGLQIQTYSEKPGYLGIGSNSPLKEQELDARTYSPQKRVIGDLQRKYFESDKKSKSPNRSPLDPSDSQKAGEFQSLADTITNFLRKKFIEEEEISTITEQIVNWTQGYLKKNAREVKILRQTVSRLQKNLELNERMEVQSIDGLSRSQRNENRVLKEIFRQCVEDSLNDLLTNKNLLGTSREFLDSEKRSELQKRVQLFEKYLSNPQVVVYLENIIADRPPEYQLTQSIAEFQSNFSTMTKEKMPSELSTRYRTLEGAKYPVRKILESMTPENKSMSDVSSNLLSNRATLEVSFKQPALTQRETHDDESLSELLSERDHRSGPSYSHWPTITTQDSKGIMLQSSGSKMFAKSSRAGSSGLGGKIRRGRAQLLDKHDSVTFKTEKNQLENSEPRFLTLNDELSRTEKSPLTRRVLVKNGKPVFT